MAQPGNTSGSLAFGGPPIPGSPWLRRLNIPAPSPQPVPPAQQQRMPERVVLGPPVPGSPWYGRVLSQPKTRLIPPSPTPGPTPVPPGRTSPVKPFLPRVPDIGSQAGKDRLRRFTEELSGIVNSLVSQGILKQTGPATWTIDASALSGTAADVDAAFLVGSGPPSPALGAAGDRYIDLDTGNFYWRT